MALHPPGPEPVRLLGCCGHRQTNGADGIIPRIGAGTSRTPCLMRHRCNMRPESLCISKASCGAYQRPLADFDSAIPRFESWRLRRCFLMWENRRYFRRLGLFTEEAQNSWQLHFVMAGLVPAIPIIGHLCHPDRDRRDGLTNRTGLFNAL